MTSSRRRTSLLLPAASAVLALTLGLAGCSASPSPADGAQDSARDPEGPASTAEPSPSAPSTTTLMAGGTVTAAKCLVPDAELLSTQPTAFEGTVTALEGGRATLAVDRWFAGEEVDEVVVAAPDDELRSLVLAVEFEVGRSYLVSALGDQVTLCGFTAEKTPELEAMYVEAFGA